MKLKETQLLAEVRQRTVLTARAKRDWVGPLRLLLLRVAMGILMLTLGLRLLTEGGWKAWMQIGGFLPGVVRGPFAGPFVALWDSPVILYLVIWSAILVGIAMILGLFVRLAAIGGATMMLLFYIATIPPQFGWVNQQLIFLLIFTLFPALGPGYQLGLDYFLIPLRKRYPVLRYVLG
ncbi:MAG TPA: DoxX family membrane protein [Candidatus Fraserbacteria bacterium]|nr:DoxX family membrane protein [Candidatus Fraserbacteria bacterium]